MRKSLAAATLVAAAFLAPPADAAIVTGYAPTGSEAVVNGVTHEWGTTQTELATQHINVLRVASGAPDVRLDLGLPLGMVNARQRTTGQAVDVSGPGHQVVGAVNGDFWQKSVTHVYAPAGLDVRRGELVAGKNDTDRAALGIHHDGSPIIGTPRLSVDVTLPGDVVVQAAGVNRLPSADQLVVYTPLFGTSTGTDASGVEVRLTGVTLPMTTHGAFSGTVAEVTSDTGNAPLSSGELVLSATGAATDSLSGLKVGEPITITTSIDDGWQDIDTAVGGALLFDSDQTPDFSDPKWQGADPRTAAGIDAQGNLLLVTVDGRSETSGGLSLPDLVTLLRSLGAVSAINLDGGGSTTMAVDPDGDAPLALANAPSQGYERRVNTTLQIVSTVVETPVVTAPAAEIVSGVQAGRTDAAVRLTWSASQPLTTEHFELQRLNGKGQWLDVALDYPQATSAVQRFTFGKSYRFRVRIVAGDAPSTDWSVSPAYVLNRFNESSAAIVRNGAWSIRSNTAAIGQHYGRSTFDGNSHLISMPINGLQVAVVVQKGRSTGIAQVTVGSASALVDTHAGASKPRMIVYVGSGSSISVRNAGSIQRPNVDLDAFLVLSQT